MHAAVVDAFTSRAFAGNPAAVVLLEEDRPDGWLQSVGAEFNLSETAFLRARDDGAWDLRWFTPTTEVELCGHATLASAHWLFERGIAAGETARFASPAGPLAAQRGAGGRVTLDFPFVPLADDTPLPGLAEALGDVPFTYLGRTGQDDPLEHNGLVLVEPSVLRDLQPDREALIALPVGGLIVTAAGDVADVDFLSRYFAPKIGIDEDPVTGSAHCTLIDYWSARLGRDDARALQVSSRGGELEVRRQGERVSLTGAAVTVFEGSLRA
jgi:predicted PhzF superfamily epimerase YddE/YHI9